MQQALRRDWQLPLLSRSSINTRDNYAHHVGSLGIVTPGSTARNGGIGNACDEKQSPPAANCDR
jgi:hypothetical protein